MPLRLSSTSRIRRSLGAVSLLLLSVGVALLWVDRRTALPEEPTAFEDAGVVPPAEGPAPDFSITLLDGSTFSLSEHLRADGRPVLLNFWASWCIPCRAEMPLLDEAAARHGDVLFLGVAVEDDPSAARAFAEEMGVGYPLAIDEAGTLAARYPFFGLPTSWLIDSEGVIVRRITGLISEDLLEEMLRSDLGA